MANHLSDFFDISIAEELEATFTTTGSDKVFLFAGPPAFSALKGTNSKLCPLLFTSGFQVSEDRQGGGTVASMGTADTLTLNSPGGRNILSVTGGAVFTGEPGNTLSGDLGSLAEGKEKTAATPITDEEISIGDSRWNLLKRVYYTAIKTPGLISYFLPDANKQSTKSSIGFKVVGATEKDMFTNFSKSEFYDLPVGILYIALNRSNSQVVARYYEGVKLTRTGATVAANAGSSASFQGQLSASFKNEVPLDVAYLQTVVGEGDDYSAFITTLKKYITGGS